MLVPWGTQDLTEVRARALGANAMGDLGRVDEAFEWIGLALEAAPDDTALLYNASCFYARQGIPDKAFEYLGRSVGEGYAHRHWIENDPDWDALREDPQYSKIMSQIHD